MSQDSQAPVKWEVGQALLPEHLMAQEKSLVAEASGRQELAGLPSYGISSIEWDTSLLSNEAILSLSTLKLVTKKGELVNYPGNSLLLTPPVELKQASQPTVIYHILQERPLDKLQTVKTLTPKVDAINRRFLKIVLSCEQVLPREYEYLLDDHDLMESGCLGNFEKPFDDGWKVSPRYVPPLLQVGNSPYMLDMLQQLLTVMLRFRSDLRQEFGARNLPKSMLYSIKQCLHAIQSNIRLLENLNISKTKDGELRLHPYYLFESLHALLTDLMLYRGEWPERDPQPYRHRDLAGSFEYLINQLNMRMKVENCESQLYEFVLKDGIYSVPLPASLTESEVLYFVVDLNSQPPIDHTNTPVITSIDRLKDVNSYALEGVNLEHLKNPGFGYEFGREVQCFRLGQEAERRYLHRDGSVGFYAQNTFKLMNFYLYRKLPEGLDVN
ncbi:type VI secretion system baseplate subunit TssK [Microbulbifer sp. ZKSA006]|uniref:type VI secretion system baseplate subunit TssK n=1 Tax=Microbulbifer sp. ZKSA006 TaxID=3243390 RepID=UPI004039B13C